MSGAESSSEETADAVEGPSLEDLKNNSDFLLFEEAICLVAFGIYQFPPKGPRHLYSLIPPIHRREDEYLQNSGRYQLAAEQILAMIRANMVKLYGRPIGEDGADTIKKDEQGFIIHPVTEMRRIAPEEIDPEDYEMDDDAYKFNGQWFDSVVVPAVELEQLPSLVNSSVAKPSKDSSSPTVVASQSDPSGEDVTNRRQRGRPRKWDWDDIYAEIARIANTPDGLPDTPAELQRIIASYCHEKWGREPAPSTLSDKLGPLYDKLNQKIQ